MRLFGRNRLKWGMLFLLPLFLLTACTSKEDIVLELDRQDEIQEIGESLASETISEADMLKENDGIQQAEDRTENKVSVQQTESTVTNNDTPVSIYVHICGAVVNPGVYALAEGSRIFEGIEAAGGFREDACEDYVNQAKPLQDGQRLVIPTVEEAEKAKEEGIYQELWMTETADTEETEEAARGEDISSGNADGLININTATESELCTINGIGAGKAAAIVKYRQENGGFTSTEDIMKVSGIGESTFEKIKDIITVN